MSPRRRRPSRPWKRSTAPVIGIALILSAVFVPVALLGGLVGSMYKQFALTIAISVLLSAFNALTLTPALCAMLLRAAQADAGPLGAFFRGLQQGLRRHHERLRERVAPAGATIVPDDRASSPRWRSGPALFATARSRPDSFPTRTRGSSASTSSCRPGRRSRARARCSSRSRRFWRKTDGHRVLSDDRRLRRRHQHLSTQLRLDLRAPEAVGRTQRARPCTSRASWRGCEAVRGHSRGGHLPIQHSRRCPDSARRRASTFCSRIAAAR